MTVALMFSRGKGLLAQIHQHGVLWSGTVMSPWTYSR